MSESTGDRLQKIIAQVGISSRRDAEDLIREGRVTVNGKTAKLGDKATLGTDAIKVNGKLIHVAATKVYYLIYKPKNVIAMIAEDEEGRPTLKDLTKRIKERVYTVGRMDFTGEGAILLTNDGDFAQRLQKSTDVIRRYQVKVDRHPTAEELAKIERGGRIEGRSMTPFHVRVANAYTKNALVEVSFEGMGQLDIRKFFENKGFFPEKIARIAIGHLSVEKMAPGTYKRIEGSSIEALFKQPELTKKQIERAIEKGSNYKFKTEEAEKQRIRDARKEGLEIEEVETFTPAPIRPRGRDQSQPYRSPSRATPREGERSFAPRSGGTAADKFADRNERKPRGAGSRGGETRGGERSYAPRAAGGDHSPRPFSPRVGEKTAGSRRSNAPSAGYEGSTPRGRTATREFGGANQTFAPRTERSLNQSFERSTERTSPPGRASFGRPSAGRAGAGGRRPSAGGKPAFRAKR